MTLGTLSPTRPSPTLRQRLADAWAEVRRRVLRRRRLLAALLIAAATAITLRTLAPPPPTTTTLQVAARDLPAGRALQSGDLVSVSVAPDVVPEGVAKDPVGQRLAAPLRAGEPVTDVRLVGPDLAAGLPAGTVGVPVRLTDAGQVALLRAGDRIRLLATDPQAGSTTELAREATVLAVPEPSSASDGALPGRLVVLALASSDVYHVTAATAGEYVTYTWSRS